MGSGILIRPCSLLHHKPGGDSTSSSFTTDTLSQRTKTGRANHLEVTRQRFGTESFYTDVHLTNVYTNHSINIHVSEYDRLPPYDGAGVYVFQWWCPCSLSGADWWDRQRALETENLMEDLCDQLNTVLRQWLVTSIWLTGIHPVAAGLREMALFRVWSQEGSGLLNKTHLQKQMKKS